MPDLLSLMVISLCAFGAVSAIVFVIAQSIMTQVRVQQRIGAPTGNAATGAPEWGSALDGLVSTYFDEKRFGVEGSVRTKLRRDLIAAGFFRADAINYYIF